MIFALTNAYYLSGLGLAARIFAIVGGILFVSGLGLTIFNRIQSEKRSHGIIDTAVTVLGFYGNLNRNSYDNTYTNIRKCVYLPLKIACSCGKYLFNTSPESAEASK